MIEWLKVHWRNGLRFQIAISILILGGIVALYLQFYNYTNKGSPEPALSVESVTVRSAVDGQMLWTKVVCNKLDGPISASVSISVESEPPIRTIPLTGGEFSDLIPPGCNARPLRLVALPDSVTPGVWKLNVALFTAASAAGGLTLVSGQSGTFEVERAE